MALTSWCSAPDRRRTRTTRPPAPWGQPVAVGDVVSQRGGDAGVQRHQPVPVKLRVSHRQHPVFRSTSGPVRRAASPTHMPLTASSPNNAS